MTNGLKATELVNGGVRSQTLVYTTFLTNLLVSLKCRTFPGRVK